MSHNDLCCNLRSLSTAASDLGFVAPALASGLTTAYDNYTTARPCMTGLLARMDNVNSTVLVLPASIAVSVPPVSQQDPHFGAPQ